MLVVGLMSALIGAGLYVDDSAGAAGATGVGEEIIRIGGSFFIVEQLRAGRSPQEACEIAAKRVIKLNLLSAKNRDHIYQVGFIAVNIRGECGAASVREGFEYAIYRDNENKLMESKYIIDEKFSVEDL